MKLKGLYQQFLSCNAICTDTRKLSSGCMFFALKGENFDGNAYAKNALDGGAKFAVVDDPEVVVNDRYILVEDVLDCLQQLANYHRQQIKAIVIALTGSNGKTTTKELILAILETTFRTQATTGNFNNHIGVPLTLLDLKSDTEYAIIEMGANHLKEIDMLCHIADPDFGYITNFGKAHLEGFGGVEGVIKGKGELYDFLKNKSRNIFINASDETQLALTSDYSHTIVFNKDETSSAQVELLASRPFVTVSFKGQKISSKLTGRYNYDNISAAIAIGDYFGVEVGNIKRAIEGYTPISNRSQILKVNSNTIILDAYNANPTSMLAALDNFKLYGDDSRIAILGDMFELGPTAPDEHQNISNYAASIGLEHIFLIGENFYSTKGNNDMIDRFRDFDDLVKTFESIKLNKKTILIKGSRGMALERLIEYL
ncbi:MAG: UDP-N-acetylmuramoyl-tripeptide--D-alanyl-D-alanine ligase [Flavobacteriaceae bacterium]|nr:UDP-N-acetylmuramoyl-tripeptide--D-alanyl-D-alanine ligase [Bacteroidia bacterium]NNF76318.1 UDP-N-acetylmuramoyl-tripeptide--D-alanyl-D-alanine ligase [Flavobacteriaceae bacterium]